MLCFIGFVALGVDLRCSLVCITRIVLSSIRFHSFHSDTLLQALVITHVNA